VSLRKVLTTCLTPFLAVAAGGLLWAAGAGCQRHDPRQAMGLSAQRPPAAVTVAGALTRDVPVYLEEIGKTVPVEAVAIVPQVGGKLTAVHVDDGAFVKKGDLLFEIDPRPFQAALASAEASVAQTTAELEWAQIDEKRIQGLYSEASATEFEYDQKRVAVAVAKAKVEGAKAAVESARLDLEYCKIFSPLDGRAGARLVDPGNVVRANDKPLLMIQRLDPIYAEFTVTENALATVRKHMLAHGLGSQWAEENLRVEVDVPSDPMAVLSALGAPASQPAVGSQSSVLSSQFSVQGGQDARPPEGSAGGRRIGPREGKLTFLDNSVQSGSGTVRLRATVPNADHYFWPGQFVNVRLILAMHKDAVLIPGQAQQVGQQGPFVYTLEAEDIAAIRPITPGQRQGNMVVVDAGLKPGERVITSGQMMVMPGAKVMVVDPNAPHGPPGMPRSGPAASSQSEPASDNAGT
jgi:multidrug efflux system membrane fusion protein